MSFGRRQCLVTRHLQRERERAKKRERERERERERGGNSDREMQTYRHYR